MKSVLIIFVLAVSLFASEKTEDIKKLIAMTGSADVGVQVLDQMVGSFKQGLPNVPAKFWDEFRKEVGPDDLTNLIIPIYDKYFTHDDIKGLISFYNTPLGKKFTKNLPQVTAESMSVGQAWGQQLGMKVAKKLSEEGYQ